MKRNLKRLIAFTSAVCLFCTGFSVPVMAEETEDVQLFSEGDVSYSWDFETDETASSGNNTPVISGAEYDSVNEMVKFAAAKDTKTLSVDLSPAIGGIITTEFDAYLASLSNTDFIINVKDGNSNDIINLSFDTYNSRDGSITIGGETIYEGKFGTWYNKVADDGIKASATHFKIEVNIPKRTASLTMSGATETKTFEGSISQDVTSMGSVAISRKSSNSNSARHCYADNLSIRSETPENAIYATGPSGVTKRIGGTTAQYEISKTYTDESEVAEWSVTGVDGLTIDNDGVLTVPENAETGTATVTVTLTAGGTMPTGTSDSIEVTINDFSQPEGYELDGSSTLQENESSLFTASKVTDADGNDITEYSSLDGFSVSDTTVATVTSGGELTGVKAGDTTLTFNLIVEKLNYTQAVTIPVKVGIYEITSSESDIDISALVNYGADTYRLYKSDKSYIDVKAEGGKVANDTGEEVTVVPVYKLNYTSDGKEGYTSAAGSYDISAGYGVYGTALAANASGVLPKDSSLRVSVPEGRYDITVERQGAARFNVYNDGYKFVSNDGLSTGVQNRPSSSASIYAPQILCADGTLDITVGGENGSPRLASLEIIRVPEKYKKHVVWISGDSESARYYPLNMDADLDDEKLMRTGFGVYLPKFLDTTECVVNNMGIPGTTAKEWYNSNFDGCYYNMDKDDIFLIDSGINEAATTDASRRLSEGEMEEWMTKMFTAVKDKGAKPLLVSPVYQASKRSHFKYESGTNTMYSYADSIGVPYIDLNKWTQLYIAKAAATTGDASWINNNYNENDKLHMAQYGALLAASFIAAGMKDMGYRTSDYSYMYKDISGTSTNAEGKIIRGSQTGWSRTYSAAAADTFMKNQDEIIQTYDASEADDPSDNPEPTNAPVLKLDFEGTVSMNSKGDAPSGWSQSNGGKAVVATDTANASINQYMQQGNASSGNRAVEYKLGSKITDSFVFEADILAKSTTEFAANLSLLSSSTTVNSTGANKTPTDGYLLKLDVLRNTNAFLINNAETTNSSYIKDITGKKILSDEYTKGSWIHVRAICDFDSKTTAVKLTSLDGKTTYFDGRADMSAEENKDLSKIYLIAPRANETFGIDNITVRKANNTELEEAKGFVSVTMVSGETSNTYYNKKGNALDTRYLPDTAVYGSYFKGWQIEGKTYTTDELKALTLGSDTTITALIDDGYVEAAAEVSFLEFPDGGQLIMSADANGDDFMDNAISLKITGVNGTDLAANPDSRANPSIAWEFTGFYTMHGVSTGDDRTTVFSGTKWYCDNYGKVTVESAYDPEISFALRNTTENYYGKVKATVSYGGKTFTVEKPLMITADGDAQPGVLLPKGGYISDYNMLEDGMDGDYTSDKLLLGGWNIVGSAGGNAVGIGKDSSGKYFKISKNAKSDSSYFYNSIDKTTDQLVFDQMIRFATPTVSMYYKEAAINSFPTPRKEAFIVAYAGNKLTLNDSSFRLNNADTAVNQNTWYRLVVSAASSSQKTFAKLYDANGVLIGETDIMDYANDVSEPYTFGYQLKDKNAASSEVDINDLTIKKAEIDRTTMRLDLQAGEMTIPDDDIPAAMKISVDNVKTTDGYDAVGKALWKIDDTSVQGVTITPDTDTHTATISVSKDAAAGDIPVTVTIDGVSVKGTIKLTGTRNSVAFTKSAKSVQIPTSGDTTASFKAVLRNGQGEEIDGAVTYALESAAEGVSIDSSTGVMAVSSAAKAAAVYVTATSGVLSRKTKVVIYTLDFTFGNGTAPSGSTPVSAEDIYDSEAGFGIEGTAADADGYIEGSNLVFKVNVEPGKVYTVKIKYKGSVALERYDSYLTGIVGESGTANTSLAEKEFKVAVVGDGTDVGTGVLDINMYGSSQQLAAVKITQEPDKQAGEKPVWIEIGDSTVAQNPSWGYVLAQRGLTAYPEINTAVEGFSNKGRGARQLVSYYNQGMLNSVLQLIRPGDVVSISGMGTNGFGGGTVSDYKNQLNYYIDSVIEMGGYVILGSYTPFGNWGSYKDKVYDPDTETFRGKRYIDYDRAVTEVYEARKNEKEILGYVDIGQISDDLMTAEVKKARDNTYGDEAAKKAAAQARAEELIKWWPNDYNHYTVELSNLILPDVTKAVAELIEKIGVESDVTVLEPFKSLLTVDKELDEDGNASLVVGGITPEMNLKPFTLYIATYNEEGALESVSTVPQEKAVWQNNKLFFPISTNKNSHKIMLWDSGNIPVIEAIED